MKAVENLECRVVMADRLHEITGWSAKQMGHAVVQRVLARAARALAKGECVVVHEGEDEGEGWYRVSRRKAKR